jgi:hypothetical protein
MRLCMLVCACALMVCPITAQAGWFDKPDPVNLNDVRSIMEALRPISKGSDTAVSMSAYADGTILISLMLPNGQKIIGYSGSLKSALHDLMSHLDQNSDQSKSASEAIKSILNEGKPSQ